MPFCDRSSSSEAGAGVRRPRHRGIERRTHVVAHGGFDLRELHVAIPARHAQRGRQRLVVPDRRFGRGAALDGGTGGIEHDDSRRRDGRAGHGELDVDPELLKQIAELRRLPRLEQREVGGKTTTARELDESDADERAIVGVDRVEVAFVIRDELECSGLSGRLSRGLTCRHTQGLILGDRDRGRQHRADRHHACLALRGTARDVIVK